MFYTINFKQKCLQILSKRKFTNISIKFFILITLILAFIYLIITFYAEQKYTKQIYTPGSINILRDIIVQDWDSDVQRLYKKQLDIEYLQLENTKNCENITTETKKTNGQYKHQQILTAFPCDKLENHIWQYISLLATEYNLQESDGNFKAYLTTTVKNVITSIFDSSSSLSTLNTLHPNCYDLSKSIIIGNTDVIPVQSNTDDDDDDDNDNENDNISWKIPIILEKSAIRYQDIIETNHTELRKKLNFRFNYYDAADRAIGLIKMHKNILITNYEQIIIGLYIGDEYYRIPDKYYRHAIDFQRKLHPNAIFLIICTDESIDYCFEFFQTNAAHIHVTQAHNGYLDFDIATLSYCNHTIISNDIGLIPAIINGGVTIVYDSQHSNRVNYLPFIFANEMHNWYAIG